MKDFLSFCGFIAVILFVSANLIAFGLGSVEGSNQACNEWPQYRVSYALVTYPVGCKVGEFLFQPIKKKPPEPFCKGGTIQKTDKNGCAFVFYKGRRYGLCVKRNYFSTNDLTCIQVHEDK